MRASPEAKGYDQDLVSLILLLLTLLSPCRLCQSLSWLHGCLHLGLTCSPGFSQPVFWGSAYTSVLKNIDGRAQATCPALHQSQEIVF